MPQDQGLTSGFSLFCAFLATTCLQSNVQSSPPALPAPRGDPNPHLALRAARRAAGQRLSAASVLRCKPGQRIQLSTTGLGATSSAYGAPGQPGWCLPSEGDVLSSSPPSAALSGFVLQAGSCQQGSSFVISLPSPSGVPGLDVVPLRAPFTPLAWLWLCVCFLSPVVSVSFTARNNKGLVERVLLSSLSSSFIPTYLLSILFQCALNANFFMVYFNIYYCGGYTNHLTVIKPP